jgi:excisionase family DNA binding protein
MDELRRDYLTATEVATSLNLPLRTVHYRLQKGLMQGIRMGPRAWLVSRDEVERWRGKGKLPPGPKPRPPA